MYFGRCIWTYDNGCPLDYTTATASGYDIIAPATHRYPCNDVNGELLCNGGNVIPATGVRDASADYTATRGTRCFVR